MKGIKYLTGLIIITYWLINHQIALALNKDEIEDIAKAITVQVMRKDSPKDVVRVGSGTLVCFNNQESKYYILTNYHVAGPGNKYIVETFDKTQYPIKDDDIMKVPNLDLALLRFSSPTTYKIPDFGDADFLNIGNTIYIYGWPLNSIAKLVPGQFSAHKLSEEGYDLSYANAKTERGMSGGPILDRNGRLVGIHGRADVFYQGGISIKSLLMQMPIISNCRTPSNFGLISYFDSGLILLLR